MSTLSVLINTLILSKFIIQRPTFLPLDFFDPAGLDLFDSSILRPLTVVYPPPILPVRAGNGSSLQF
ncbi:MAG: hypothetical protein DRJ65_16245 [Acidobacteria bacterium]|nr:MAG: hypothetical protein DRJ65_16245 [Acidobacteriota bacterium]